MRANFHACLQENGLVVPGSRRVGHNVFTNFGREWLAQLVGWSTIGVSTDDIEFTNFKVRWLMVGTGTQLEQVGVARLVSGLTVTTGPDVYLREVPDPPTIFPTTSSVRWVTTYTGASADFDHHGASVDVTEAGLFVDEDSGGGPSLSTGDPNLNPVAYKTFPVLTKLAAQDLIIRWEFRF